jgi:hypothetical protein
MLPTKRLERVFRSKLGGEARAVDAEGRLDRRVREILLREHELFEGLDESRMQHIAKRMPMQRCHRGHAIYEPGISSERLYILKEGRARL